jgi:hypothetical protein
VKREMNKKKENNLCLNVVKKCEDIKESEEREKDLSVVL